MSVKFFQGGINPNGWWHFDFGFVIEIGKGFCFMKQMEEKVKRTVKYWRVRYKQASGRDRLYIGLFALMILTYVWWFTLLNLAFWIYRLKFTGGTDPCKNRVNNLLRTLERESVVLRGGDPTMQNNSACKGYFLRVSLCLHFVWEWLGPGGLPGLQNLWRVALRAAVGSTPIHSRLIPRR